MAPLVTALLCRLPEFRFPAPTEKLTVEVCVCSSSPERERVDSMASQASHPKMLSQTL